MLLVSKGTGALLHVPKVHALLRGRLQYVDRLLNLPACVRIMVRLRGAVYLAAGII